MTASATELPEAGLRVPGVPRLCRERLQRVPRTVREHQGYHALLRQDRGCAEQLGATARLGLPHGPPCAVPEAELQLCGRIEALSGAPFDVKFISFDDIKADPKVLDSIDVLINVGDGDTAHTGGKVWEDPDISAAVKGFVHRGGGLIGVGEPGGHQYQGRYLQLSAPLGVEKETGFTLNYDKYNWDEHRDHFILADCPDHDVDFGEGKKSIFALEGTEILIQRDKEVQMAAHEYGKGRGVYISGLPYSFVNNRVLYRAILWAAHDEADLHKWFSTNYNVEVHAYVKNGKYCVVNNTYEPQDTTVYTGDGSCFDLHLDTNEIKWYSIEG